MRHTQIEKSLNRKMRPRYTGPLMVVSCNRGGAYVLCELDHSVLHCAIAAFRLIPYLAHNSRLSELCADTSSDTSDTSSKPVLDTKVREHPAASLDAGGLAEYTLDCIVDCAR